MAVKRYEVEQDLGKGRKVTTTMKLNEADAKRLGVFEEPKKTSAKKATPANKARTAANKKG